MARSWCQISIRRINECKNKGILRERTGPTGHIESVGSQGEVLEKGRQEGGVLQSIYNTQIRYKSVNLRWLL